MNEDNTELVENSLASNPEAETETDIESNTEAESDTDSDIDIDDDSDTEVEAEFDTDIDSDTDAETESESNSDADIDDDSDTEVEAESDTDIDSDTDAETESESNIDAEIEVESVGEVEADNSNSDDSEDASSDSLLETIDLSDLDDQTVRFTVDRDAGFENSVGFYEVTEEGGILDPISGEEIALGESGYEDAAIANSLDFSLSSPTGQLREFVTELSGGKQYATYIIADGTIDQLLDSDSGNDPAIYFGAASANPDNFDYVRSLGENTFGYEDTTNGGDNDFNDLVVNFELI